MNRYGTAEEGGTENAADILIVEHEDNNQDSKLRSSQAQLLDHESMDNAVLIPEPAHSYSDFNRSPWASLWIANLILLLGSIQFSIFFSSLWPYLEQLDQNAKEESVGWLIAGFAIGQLVSSPLFGFWSNKIKQAKLPIAVGVLTLIAANFLYVFVQAFPVNMAFRIILLSRVISGIGSGNASVIRAYIATASTYKDRGTAIALGTAALTMGYILGPGLQAVFAFIGYPGYVKGPLHFDVYTAPGYFANVANMLLLLLLLTSFHEKYAGLVPTSASNDPLFVLPRFDKLAVFILIWAWFTLLFMTVNVETLAAPYTMAMFDWSKIDAVTYNGIILAISAVFSFIVYLGYAAKLSSILDDRLSIIFGTIMVGSFYVITWPWPVLPGQLSYYQTAIENTTLQNATGNNTTTQFPTPLDSMLSSNLSSSTMEPEVGCKPEYDWCEYTPPVPLWLYLTMWPLMSIGYPAATVAISTLFSKVIGPRRQGTMQGLVLASGSLARTVGPISMSYLFQSHGPRAAWALCAVLALLTLLPYPCVIKRLVPLDMCRTSLPATSSEPQTGRNS